MILGVAGRNSVLLTATGIKVLVEVDNYLDLKTNDIKFAESVHQNYKIMFKRIYTVEQKFSWFFYAVQNNCGHFIF